MGHIEKNTSCKDLFLYKTLCARTNEFEIVLKFL